MSQLADEQLAKRSRELEEREQALNFREGLLEREKALEKRQKVFDESETKLDVLNKQIKFKEAILSTHTFELEKLIQDIEEATIQYKKLSDSHKEAVALQNKVLANLGHQESQKNSEIKAKKAELADLQAQVKETKKYRDDQAKIVENTIAEWNSTLVEFRKEADAIQEDKNKLSADIIRLEQDKTSMIIEDKKLEGKLEALAQQYEDKVEVYKSELRTLDIQVKDRQREYEGIVTSLEMRKKEVETKEKSFKLKEQAVNAREYTLDQKERRLKMNYGIAGIDYENEV